MTNSAERCVVTAGGLALEGRFRSGRGPAGAVVAPPHPLYGGELSNPVVLAAAEGFDRAGLATLRFNYRGIGASEGGATDNLDAARADYGGALDALAGRVPGPYVAAGYSFGSVTALAVAATDARVSGAVLVAPPAEMVRSIDLSAFTAPLLVIVGDRDTYAPVARLTTWLAGRSDVTLHVVPGADHFFQPAGTSAITEHVAAFRTG
ncbi:MAG TPA: alpha/beta family hydrolase [Pseudonocardia sp.]